MNARAEEMTLWGLLWFTHFHNIPDIHIFGDSKIIVDHVKGCANIKQQLLLRWLWKIDNQWTLFNNSSIMHIIREYNQQADELSKRGLQEHLGGMHIEIKLGDTILDAGVFPFPG